MLVWRLCSQFRHTKLGSLAGEICWCNFFIRPLLWHLTPPPIAVYLGTAVGSRVVLKIVWRESKTIFFNLMLVPNVTREFIFSKAAKETHATAAGWKVSSTFLLQNRIFWCHWGQAWGLSGSCGSSWWGPICFGASHKEGEERHWMKAWFNRKYFNVNMENSDSVVTADLILYQQRPVPAFVSWLAFLFMVVVVSSFWVFFPRSCLCRKTWEGAGLCKSCAIFLNTKLGSFEHIYKTAGFRSFMWEIPLQGDFRM